MQQKRQFALQRNQLARQRVTDQHQAKLRPFELSKMKAEEQIRVNRMQMLKDYPKMVESLPVPENIKAHLLTLPPTEGLDRMKTIMTKNMNRTKMIPAGKPDSFGNIHNVDLQQKGDGTLIKSPGSKKIVPLPKHDRRRDNFSKHDQDFLQLDMTYGGDGQVIIDPAASSIPNQYTTVSPEGLYPDGVTVNKLQTPVQVSEGGQLSAPFGTTTPDNFVSAEGDPRLADYPKTMQKHLRINKKDNSISFPPSFTKEMQKLALREGRPLATDRFKTFQKENPNAEFKSFADLGRWTGTSQESKLWFATQNLAPNHPLHIDAQNQLNLKHIKVTPNAIIIGKGYKDPNNPSAASRLPEPTTEEILTGDTVSSLAKRFGTTESQIIAANPDWFNKDMNGKADVLSMRTSEQMEDAEMIIPTGKSQLSPSQIREAHSSKRRARVTEMPYGTIIPIQTATVGDGLRLNTERLEMQNIQRSVKDFVELMKNPKARGFGKIGPKEKGELEGIRQRLINNVQVLRDYGVLSPSEIQNIERSVPPVNSIISLMTRGLGSDEFVVGAMNKLYEEAVNNELKLDALIKLYGAPQIDYERYSGGIPGLNTGQKNEGSASKNFVDQFRD
jgi:LysM repeat protein